MGGPRKIHSKVSRPRHPWRLDRITEENKLLQEYGLKAKREIWRVQSQLKTFTNQAKKLIAATGAQAVLEKSQLLGRLARLGLVSQSAGLDDVLGLSITDFLNRRLQTLVSKKGLAKNPKQARQFVTHEHIIVGTKKITSPGYLVPVAEEQHISFVSNSSLANPDHPERAVKQSAPVKQKPEAEVAA